MNPFGSHDTLRNDFIAQLKHPPVLIISLDAAETTLIQKWMAEGSLPNLSALRKRGSFGNLQTAADWLVSSPWPDVYTGTGVEEHGFSHYLVWRPDKMVSERPNSDWMPMMPFWRQLNGRRVVVVDIPNTYPPEEFNGVEVSAWSTSDVLSSPSTHPPELMDWIGDHVGAPPCVEDAHRPATGKELLAIRDRWIQTTERATDLGLALMAKEHPWDLFFICLTATHHGGHKFWNLTGASEELGADEKVAVLQALKEIYIACDAAVGRLIEQVEDDATVIVFSPVGMGPNTSRSELLPEMLRRILEGTSGATESSNGSGLLKWLRKRIPLRWRTWVKSRLPLALQDRLTLFWRSGKKDWSRTPAFCLFSDLSGYIRINLRGREAAGIVEPGEEYDRLCAEIAAGLVTFVDEDSGEPVVRDITKIADLYQSGRMLHHLPDLIVRWSARAAAEHRCIASPRYGSIPWPTPGLEPSGRSGEHSPDGFIIACGDRFRPGGTIAGANILDLAPTVYSLLNLPVPPEMRGRPLNDIGRH
jgi:predicted AlkP superfamily phosphohydrolase/phosphomutase